jgi:hypothetical protein
MYTENKVLQAATVIAKTTQTLIGEEINCEKGRYLTIFFTYTKGNETGLLMKPYVMDKPGGTKHQISEVASTSGAWVNNLVSITLTATTTRAVTFDVRGVAAFRLEAAGSNNDGTPTGTLAASYTLKE